ncbi:MAG: phosphodiester glycosidase family protein [Myxococcales bacterium]|nr:phosphodiester glycosidase family protein [Myxococcales bacterium]MCB9707443.1 phosphodiester glycosidase family protein [Myxococcales bacterium]
MKRAQEIHHRRMATGVPGIKAARKMRDAPMRIAFALVVLAISGNVGPGARRALAEGRKGRIVEDRWSEPNQGVRHLMRITDTPCRIHALLIDLSVPGVRVLTTPYEQRWQTVSDFARTNHLAAAINGGFWGKMMRAWGVAAGGGQRWPTGEDDEEIGFFAVTRGGKAWISPPERVVEHVPLEQVGEAVSGMPELVRDRHVDHIALDSFPYARYRHPRSAVGVGKGGSLVILVVASGRQSHSRGLTLYEMAELLVELGAENAINLDGGGSSTVFIAEEGGVVNSPSGGRWIARLGLGAEEHNRKVYRTRTGEEGKEEAFVRGVEREVMNHIGVFAPIKGHPALPTAASSEKPVPSLIISTPRPPPISLGRFREVVFPVALGAGVILVLTSVGFGFLWYRRQRKSKRATRDIPRQSS